MEQDKNPLHETLGAGSSLWAIKTPEEVLADMRAFIHQQEAAAEPRPLLVYDLQTGLCRPMEAKDLDVGAHGRSWGWPRLPQNTGIVERLEANERAVRVQPRVIRNQPKNHPIKAFRRPW